MHRRTVLRSGLAAVGVGAAAVTVGGVDASGYEPLGEVEIPGAKELSVAGEVGYVAATDGFVTVDLSDPTDPVVLAERRDLFADREGGPMGLVWDLQVDGDTLAVAGPAQGTSGLRGFGVFDVSDPAAPTLRSFKALDTYIHNCALADGHVFVTANSYPDNRVLVFDASGSDVTQVGSWSLFDHDNGWSDVGQGLRALHDVTVADGTAYLAYWDAGTWFLDVSDPSDPSHLGHVADQAREDLSELSNQAARAAEIEPPGNAHYADVSDDASTLAVGRESWDYTRGDETGGPSGIDLYDVADVADPVHRATLEPAEVEDATQLTGTWTTAHNFELRGGRLYTSWYEDGTKLFDVSDPANPEQLAHWRAPETHSMWTAQAVVPGEYFAASNMGTAREPASILTFPDEAGTQTDMPPLNPTPTPTATATTTPTETATVDGSPTPTDSPRATSPTPTGTATATPTETATESPGFGTLATLGGVSAAVWRLVRDRPD